MWQHTNSLATYSGQEQHNSWIQMWKSGGQTETFLVPFLFPLKQLPIRLHARVQNISLKHPVPLLNP